MLMMYRKKKQIDEIKLMLDFSANEVEHLRDEFNYIVNRGESLLLIDLSELNSIDKEALELLLDCSQKAKSKKGWLALVAPSKRIIETIRRHFPANFFRIFFTKEKAIAAMGV